jgi:F-type H+-transporting ATPase subunit b
MLDISPILLLSSGIVFLLVLARLNSCLYKPLFKHMDDRTESIAKDLADAKNNSSNIDGMLVEAKEVIAKAKTEASLIREKAIAQAKEATNSKLTTAKADLDTKYNDFVILLTKEKESLKESLVTSMPIFKESLKLKISSI